MPPGEQQLRCVQVQGQQQQCGLGEVSQHDQSQPHEQCVCQEAQPHPCVLQKCVQHQAHKLHQLVLKQCVGQGGTAPQEW